jgi:ATP-dependent Zn protease
MTDDQLSPLLKRKQRELVAYHEAGHAVMDILVGIKFYRVIFHFYKGKIFGETVTPPETINSVAALFSYCAGRIAENEWGPHESKLEEDFEETKDYDDMVKTLEQMDNKLTEKLRDAWLQSVKIETKRVLTINKKHIKNVARALLKRKELTYQEVTVIMGGIHDEETSKSLLSEMIKNIQDDLAKMGIKLMMKNLKIPDVSREQQYYN